jgi:hypothetical protein
MVLQPLLDHLLDLDHEAWWGLHHARRFRLRGIREDIDAVGLENLAGDDWVPVKHLSFTPEDVEGGLVGPEGELIEIVQRAAQPSLIEIRAGFEAEVVKTMENM